MAGWMKTPLGTEVDLGPGHIVIGREFVTSAKKFANFNEFPESKKIVKFVQKFVKFPSVGLPRVRLPG